MNGFQKIFININIKNIKKFQHREKVVVIMVKTIACML